MAGRARTRRKMGIKPGSGVSVKQARRTPVFVSMDIEPRGGGAARSRPSKPAKAPGRKRMISARWTGTGRPAKADTRLLERAVDEVFGGRKPAKARNRSGLSTREYNRAMRQLARERGYTAKPGTKAWIAQTAALHFELSGAEAARRFQEGATAYYGGKKARGGKSRGTTARASRSSPRKQKHVTIAEYEANRRAGRRGGLLRDGDSDWYYR